MHLLVYLTRIYVLAVEYNFRSLDCSSSTSGSSSLHRSTQIELSCGFPSRMGVLGQGQTHLVCGELILEKNNTMNNWFPQTSVTTVGLVRSPAECGLHCLRVGWCQAMIYDVIENVCNLSNRSSTVSVSYWKPNTTYFQVKQTVPDGYKCDVFTKSCATVMDSLYSWADAIDKCSDVGARLLMIESAKKQSETEQFMENEGLIYAWLGLTDQTIQGRWTDPDGGQALYTYFNNGR